MSQDESPQSPAPPPATQARANIAALQALLVDSYGELRTIARRILAAEGRRGLIDPTELANEASMRLLKLDRMQFEDRPHFLALAARVVRQTLLDEIRRNAASKRRAPEATLWPDESDPVDIEALGDVLQELERVSPEHARLVDMRFFSGLTLEEIAALENVSLSTMKRRWMAARAWLLDAMS